jgi:hypothetical protein
MESDQMCEPPLLLNICAPISLGEFIDKLSILEIKLRRINDPDKRLNIHKELVCLQAIFNDHGLADNETIQNLKGSLMAINERLWQIEDDIRELERLKDFGASFVNLARSVYLTNDLRADIKRQISLALDSSLLEEKSYLTN